MKLLVFLLIFSTQLWAKTESRCSVVSGFYENSDVTLTDIKFETFADIFTLNNAKTFSFKYGNEEIRFQRKDMSTNRYTKMFFNGVEQLSKTHAALLTIDRKPKEALETREFHASLLVTMPLEKNATNSTMVYNLFCTF